MQRAHADRIEVILGDAVTSAVGGKLTPAVATMVSNMSVGEGTPEIIAALTVRRGY
jgi:hypothetical protein